MKNLKYTVSCKSCLKTDGIDHMILVIDGISELYENRMLKSEYSMGQYIKSYLKENDKPCQFCNSDNLEISDIKLNDRKVLVGRQVDQFQLVITKDNTGYIEMRTGGDTYFPPGFISEAFKLIELTVKNTYDIEFEEKQVGNVRFVVATGFIGDDDFRTTRLEQFAFVGFSKESLLKNIELMKSQFN